MKELLEALGALERLGAEWRARRVSKKFLLDTVECTTFIQKDEGVVRGIVGVQKWDGYCRTKMEVACYLDGRLKDNGTFKHVGHAKDKTVKLFEYENETLYQYSKMFGVALGWRPVDVVPTIHQFLVEFSERLIAETDAAKKAAEEEETTVAGERQRENEMRARRALFG